MLLSSFGRQCTFGAIGALVVEVTGLEQLERLLDHERHRLELLVQPVTQLTESIGPDAQNCEDLRQLLVERADRSLEKLMRRRLGVLPGQNREHPRQCLAVEGTQLAELAAQAHDGRAVLGLHVLTSPVDRASERVEAVSDDGVEAPVVQHLTDALGSRPESRSETLAGLLLDGQLRDQGRRSDTV